MGSPSCGGDVMVYVFNRNQPSLPTPFYSVLVSISVVWQTPLLKKRFKKEEGEREREGSVSLR